MTINSMPRCTCPWSDGDITGLVCQCDTCGGVYSVRVLARPLPEGEAAPVAPVFVRGFKPAPDGAADQARRSMDSELRALDAVARRLVNLIGNDDLASRVERRVTDGGDLFGVGSVLAGRKHEVAVDGLVVWRGEWIDDMEKPYRTEWRERWLIDPERISRAAHAT